MRSLSLVIHQYYQRFAFIFSPFKERSDLEFIEHLYFAFVFYLILWIISFSSLSLGLLFLISYIGHLPFFILFFKCSLLVVLFCISITYKWLVVYSMVVRQSYTLQSVPWYSQRPPGPTHSHHNVTASIPCAVLCIPMTVLQPPVCTSPSLHLLTQSPDPSTLWQPSVCSLCLRVCFCFVCSFILFFRCYI